MATQSKIEWTETTWNPVTGCTKVSSGCKHCYAERMAKRLQAMGVPRYQNAFKLTIHEDLIHLPLHWKQPRLVFVNSMSDLFHEDIPIDFIKKVFKVMRNCPQHTFQILTKRSDRMRKIASSLPWPSNVWMGVSIENASVIHRVLDLQSMPASVRFLSCEPLLGPIEHLPLKGIHWVIVGGESGPFARPIQSEWIELILQDCQLANVPFFFKQWGGVRKDLKGRSFHGRTYDEMPVMTQFNY
jgi:protein gp37